ncbi:MAG: carboxypeptidase regulatory-like domain-containing protein, partial [Deltaproteobacteria bacterium]|nr:carboxypeptidase regulatory-like domain-containing protein [Deltaproteobacteria bacterium]
MRFALGQVVPALVWLLAWPWGAVAAVAAEPPGSLRGTVRLARQAVVGAQVTGLAAPTGQTAPPLVHTDADGAFAMALPATATWLRATAELRDRDGFVHLLRSPPVPVGGGARGLELSEELQGRGWVPLTKSTAATLLAALAPASAAEQAEAERLVAGAFATGPLADADKARWAADRRELGVQRFAAQLAAARASGLADDTMRVAKVMELRGREAGVASLAWLGTQAQATLHAEAGEWGAALATGRRLLDHAQAEHAAAVRPGDRQRATVWIARSLGLLSAAQLAHGEPGWSVQSAVSAAEHWRDAGLAPAGAADLLRAGQIQQRAGAPVAAAAALRAAAQLAQLAGDDARDGLACAGLAAVTRGGEQLTWFDRAEKALRSAALLAELAQLLLERAAVEAAALRWERAARVGEAAVAVLRGLPAGERDASLAQALGAHGLGRVHLALGQPAKAVAVLREAAGLRAGQPLLQAEDLAMLGAACQATGQLDEAAAAATAAAQGFAREPERSGDAVDAWLAAATARARQPRVDFDLFFAACEAGAQLASAAAPGKLGQILPLLAGTLSERGRHRIDLLERAASMGALALQRLDPVRDRTAWPEVLQATMLASDSAAAAAREAGDLARALALGRRHLALARQYWSPAHVDAAFEAVYLAAALAGRHVEAAATLREHLEALAQPDMQRALAAVHTGKPPASACGGYEARHGGTWVKLGDQLRWQARPTDAAAAYRAAAVALSPGGCRDAKAAALVALVQAHLAARDVAAARAATAEVAALARDSDGRLLADTLQAQIDAEFADSLAEVARIRARAEAVQRQLTARPRAATAVAAAARRLAGRIAGSVLDVTGPPVAALAAYRSALAGAPDAERGAGLWLVARTSLRLGRHQEALETLRTLARSDHLTARATLAQRLAVQLALARLERSLEHRPQADQAEVLAGRWAAQVAELAEPTEQEQLALAEWRLRQGQDALAAGQLATAVRELQQSQTVLARLGGPARQAEAAVWDAGGRVRLAR